MAIKTFDIGRDVVSSEFANPVVWIVEGLLVVFIVAMIFHARSGRQLFIRRIPGLASIDEAIGRSTEMGRPIVFAPGLSGLDIVGLQAMSILAHVMRQAAKYGARVIVTLADPILYTLAEEVVRDAYNAEGCPERFSSEDIRFLSSRQFAWASGIVGILHREKVASALYFGSFFGESLILAENGQIVGAIQVAGTPSTTQVPFFLAACDYVIIGDEYYAASAYLSREPTLLGSLVGQDYGKLFILLLILVGAVCATSKSLFPGSQIAEMLSAFFSKYFLKGP